MKNVGAIIFFLFVALISMNIEAQTVDGWFNFAPFDLDSTEVEFAPSFPLRPIGDNDFVSISPSGHFQVNGEPIKFWGTPCYPIKEDYVLSPEGFKVLAREYRKMGVNLVRIHTFDSKDFFGENTIFGDNEGTRTFDPEMVDRLDYMVSEFKKQGIYFMFDMLTDRRYEAVDGVQDPDSVNSGRKMVNFYDTTLIRLQKEYAYNLLTHVNPYTGLAYKDEPAMAIIDIVNEGWLLHSVRCDGAKPISDGGLLSQYHYDMLTGLWNGFLEEKYLTEENLMEDWGLWPYSFQDIPNGGFESGSENWDYGYNGSMVATIDISETEYHSEGHSWHLNAESPGQNLWECYLIHNNITMEPGGIYTLKFWAKSENENTINSIIYQDNVWLMNEQTEISGDWQPYTLTFRADSTLGSSGSISFELGLVDGNLWVDDVDIIKGAEHLPDGGSLANNDIRLLKIWENGSVLKQRELDQSEFYIKIQTDYFTEMKSYIQNEIGVRIPVTGSNYLVGIPDFYAQHSTDFIDNHGYWVYGDYYPQSQLVHPQYDNALITMFAGVRAKNKPLTVSEFNYTLPNPSGNEALFLYTAYGSLQQADMLLMHGYDYGELWNGILLNNLDNYHRIYDKAMLPSFAYVFRNDLIAKANEVINVSFTEQDVNNLIFRDDEMWETGAWPNDYPFKLMYQHGLQSDYSAGIPYNATDYPSEPENPYVSDTEELKWDTTGLFTINTEQFQAMVGELNHFSGASVNDIELINADKWGGITLLALDELPIHSSEKLLMTVTTQQINDEMVVSGAEIIDVGHAPLMIEAMEISFNLTSDADTLIVHWLDEHGNPSGYYEAFGKNDNNVIPVTINTYDHNGIWFGIEAAATEPEISLFDIPYQKKTGDNIVIRWLSGETDSLSLYYSIDQGITLNEIATTSCASDSVVWQLPDIPSDSCSIFAFANNDYQISDTISFPVIHFEDLNYIKNGFFDNGMNYWDYYPDNDPGLFVVEIVDNELKAKIVTPPEEFWHYSVYQNDIYLEDGEYMVEFDARFPENNYTYMSCSMSNQQNWYSFFNEEAFMYRWESEKHYEYLWNYNAGNNVPLNFVLSVGDVADEIYIDNVILRRKVTASTPLTEVTFRVDMQNEGPVSEVYLRGSFNSWSGTEPLDHEGSIYYKTLSLTPGETIEYKFVHGDEWETVDPECAFGETGNRQLFVGTNDTILEAFCFDSCRACGASGIAPLIAPELMAYPNPTTQKVFISGNINTHYSIRVINTMGETLWNGVIEEKDYSLSLSGYPAGLYILEIKSGDNFHRIKILKQTE